MATPHSPEQETKEKDAGDIPKFVAIAGAPLTELSSKKYIGVADAPAENGKEFLLKHLRDQSIKVPIFMVQIFVAGMPHCGKTMCMHELLKGGLTELPPGVTADNIGERSNCGLSSYELIALASEKTGSVIKWVASTKHTSYAYSILSGILRKKNMTQPLLLKPPSDDSNEGLRGFQKDVLDNHFQELYSRLHYLTQMQSVPVGVEVQKQLKFGLSIVNIWDVGINASLLYMLPHLIGYLDHSFPMLALSLERDPDCMTEHFIEEDFEHEQNIEVIKMHRKRENYIFRFCHMAKSNFKPQRNRKSCKVVFLTKSIITEGMKEKAKELMTTKILPRAEHYNVASLIDDNPIVCNNQSSESVSSLRSDLEKIVRENKNDVCIDVPISWMFLRSAVYASGNMFIKTNDFKKLAEKCSIREEDFYKFLRAFTSMGSMIYAPSILEEYVILNPFDFFKKLNELFCPYFNGDLRFGLVTLYSLRRMFSAGDDLKFFQALLKSCHFAVKLNTSRFMYNITINYPTCEDCYYIPAMRKQYYNEKLNLEHSLIMVKSKGFPHGDIQSMIVDTLLSHDRKKEVCIVASEFFNVTKFYYKPDGLAFSLISHGEALELNFETPISSLEFMQFLVKVLRRAMLRAQRIIGEPDQVHLQPFSEIFAIPCTSCIGNANEPVYEKVHFLQQVNHDACHCGVDNQWIKVSDELLKKGEHPTREDMLETVDKLLKFAKEPDGHDKVREALAANGLPVPDVIDEWRLLELLAKCCGDASATIEELDNLSEHVCVSR